MTEIDMIDDEFGFSEDDAFDFSSIPDSIKSGVYRVRLTKANKFESKEDAPFGKHQWSIGFVVDELDEAKSYFNGMQAKDLFISFWPGLTGRQRREMDSYMLIAKSTGNEYAYSKVFIREVREYKILGKAIGAPEELWTYLRVNFEDYVGQCFLAKLVPSKDGETILIPSSLTPVREDEKPLLDMDETSF